MTPLDPSTIIPVRLLAVHHRAWRERLLAGAADGALALMLNVAAVAGLVALAFPRGIPPAPQSIAVDLVREVPGTAGAKATSDKGLGASPAAPASQKKDTPAASAPPPDPDRLAEPQTQAEEPRAQPASTGARPQPQPTPPAVPPPVGSDQDPTPRLVAAPPDPREAARQADKNMAANGETKPADTPKPTEHPPAPAPTVLATPAATDNAVPEARSTLAAPKPAPLASAEAERQAENTAKLAALLPFSQSFAPSANRAAISGSGSSASDEYRGAVYGSIRKSDDLVAEAQARHLRGHPVVMFSIDDAGELTSIKIALSSGNPEVDRIALEMIRRSAPFPPPPPGAQRTFAPAIVLGADEP